MVGAESVEVIKFSKQRKQISKKPQVEGDITPPLESWKIGHLKICLTEGVINVTPKFHLFKEEAFFCCRITSNNKTHKDCGAITKIHPPSPVLLWYVYGTCEKVIKVH
jgi:hypothetical protein